MASCKASGTKKRSSESIKGRHPLAFKQLITVDDHRDHQRMVQHLADSKRPAIVIAGGGMCSGGRIVNYLEAMLDEPRHNVLFVGYQAQGTLGHLIQKIWPTRRLCRYQPQAY